MSLAVDGLDWPVDGLNRGPSQAEHTDGLDATHTSDLRRSRGQEISRLGRIGLPACRQ